MSAKHERQAEDCAKPVWFNLVFTHRGNRVYGISTAAHGLPRAGDFLDYSCVADDHPDLCGTVREVSWGMTTSGALKATVRVEDGTR